MEIPKNLKDTLQPGRLDISQNVKDTIELLDAKIKYSFRTTMAIILVIAVIFISIVEKMILVVLNYGSKISDLQQQIDVISEQIEEL